MNHGRSESPPGGDSVEINVDGGSIPASSSRTAEPALGHAGVRLDMATAREAAETSQHRNRSPSPPRSLFRSTTGKGVAFTQEDVNFLMKFMAYRKYVLAFTTRLEAFPSQKFHHRAQGSLDLVAFWRDVAAKAPHHSRASWMKFWRRHKHELDWEDGDDPLPPPPDKKLRYSKGDDLLLARYFLNKPDGTSDKVFQAFGRLVSPAVGVIVACVDPLYFYSILIIHGKVGKSIIGSIERRSTNLSSDWLTVRISMKVTLKKIRFTFVVLEVILGF